MGLYEIEPDQDHVRWATESLAFDEKIYNELNDNRPDIILSYYLPDSLFKPLGIPNIVYLSGYPSQKVPWYKAFIKFCHATISISSIVAEKRREETDQVALNYLLGTGVDYPLKFKEEIVPKAKFNLVYAGRHIERKGVITLVEAFKRVVAQRDDVHLWMLGDGELIENTKDRIREYQLSDYITMTGVVKNPYDYFRMADVCIFPSHIGDGLMGVVLESMASGKPVITTTENGNEDVIKNGINGILVAPNNIDMLVYEINRLLGDDLLRTRLGENAEKFISENMTWEKNCKKLADILQEVVIKTKR